MKNARQLAWLVSMCIPLLAQAQAYKCKQANGAMSFQDHPCVAGATGSAMALPPANGGNVAADSKPAERKPSAAQRAMDKEVAEADGQRRRAEQEARAHNQEVDKRNRNQRCNIARQQLGILKEARPVFSRDNNGERHYVSDENRQAEINAAARRVAENCN